SPKFSAVTDSATWASTFGPDISRQNTTTARDFLVIVVIFGVFVKKSCCFLQMQESIELNRISNKINKNSDFLP
ncbi:MAG: hypothetical protein QF663_10930, partial [Verrucomicrobiota bacterium]|nr:hypothetical protein [Verrucomicrobiota bacterium]